VDSVSAVADGLGCPFRESFLRRNPVDWLLLDASRRAPLPRVASEVNASIRSVPTQVADKLRRR
jgi:hypothetical protein